VTLCTFTTQTAFQGHNSSVVPCEHPKSSPQLDFVWGVADVAY